MPNKYDYSNKKLPADQVHWVCQRCGETYGRGRPSYITVSTWHEDYCEVCNQLKAVTEIRDFGGLDLKKYEQAD